MRAGNSRVPIERFAWIAEKLRLGRFFKTGDVARQFEVSYKTAWRDIEFMRDRLGYEIEFNGEGPVELHSWVGRQPKRRIL